LQNIASIPEEIFEEHIKEVIEDKEELTSAGLLKFHTKIFHPVCQGK